MYVYIYMYIYIYIFRPAKLAPASSSMRTQPGHHPPPLSPSLSLSLSPSLSLFLSPSLPLSLTLSLSFTHSLPLAFSLARACSLSPPRPLSLSLLSLSLSSNQSSSNSDVLGRCLPSIHCISTPGPRPRARTRGALRQPRSEESSLISSPLTLRTTRRGATTVLAELTDSEAHVAQWHAQACGWPALAAGQAGTDPFKEDLRLPRVQPRQRPAEHGLDFGGHLSAQFPAHGNAQQQEGAARRRARARRSAQVAPGSAPVVCVREPHHQYIYIYIYIYAACIYIYTCCDDHRHRHDAHAAASTHLVVSWAITMRV